MGRVASELTRGTTCVDMLPVQFNGIVTKGFGRGSKQLGCPTANIPIQPYKDLLEELPTGVYYGFASFPDSTKYKNDLFATALSIGWNPFYKNQEKTIEAHLIHEFGEDFYDESLHLQVLGYIRPEWNFTSLSELIQAIKDDVAYSVNILEKDEYQKYKEGMNYSVEIKKE